MRYIVLCSKCHSKVRWLVWNGFGFYLNPYRFVVTNPRVMSVNRVDFGLFYIYIYIFSNFTPPPPRPIVCTTTVRWLLSTTQYRPCVLPSRTSTEPVGGGGAICLSQWLCIHAFRIAITSMTRLSMWISEGSRQSCWKRKAGPQMSKDGHPDL